MTRSAPTAYETQARQHKVAELASLARLNHISAATLAEFDDAGWDNLAAIANTYRKARGETQHMGTPSELTRTMVLAALTPHQHPTNPFADLEMI